MKKMAVGDWIVLYAPRAVQDGPIDFLQEFAAIGEVTGEAPYAVQVSPEFAPFRRVVRYEACKSASVLPMVPTLSFIRDKRLWGVPFRAGHFDMPRGDFMLIARAMLGRIPG